MEIENLLAPPVEYPDYIVVWLDENIGRPEEYSSLKRQFDTMIDVNCALQLTGDDWRDFENLIQIAEEPLYGAIHFFDEPENC